MPDDGEDTLQAATGQGSSGSAWEGLLSTVGSIGQTAATVYNAFSGRQDQAATPAATATPAPASSAGSWSKYLPWIITAAGVLVLALLFLRRK